MLIMTKNNNFAILLYLFIILIDNFLGDFYF